MNPKSLSELETIKRIADNLYIALEVLHSQGAITLDTRAYLDGMVGEIWECVDCVLNEVEGENDD